jgi:beta-alanine--pyruvate transaminase
VITGFGRLGQPFGAQFFDVLPDIMTTAKGLTNGAIPMGAVFVRNHVYDAFMSAPEGAIELYHGYTYSGHPVACAAGLATQKIYADEGLLTRAAELAPYWQEAAHSLQGLPHVIDVRNLGLIAGIELEAMPAKPGARAFGVFKNAFERGLLIRVTGDIIALSPPLIIEKPQIDQIFGMLGEILKTGG